MHKFLIMKIFLLGPAYPFRGGLAAFDERLAREFQKQGFEVKIITFTLQYPGFLFPGKTQFANWDAPNDLNITRMLSSVNPLSWHKTGRYIRKEKPDLLIINYWLPFMAPAFGTVAKIARKNNHTKVISVVHNILPHEPHPGDKLLSAYFVKHSQAFVALSKAVLKQLNSFDPLKPKAFSPHPIYDIYGKAMPKEIALQKLNLPADFNYILFFGLIRDYKGLDLLLKAMAEKELQNRKLKLIIAGEFYDNKEKYMKIIDEYGLHEKIIFHSYFIPDNRVAEFFCAADLVVQPYKSATQSGVTQIAYHFEKPMVVTNVGGLPEIVPHGKCGYVVEPDPKQIARAIDDFFSNQKADTFKPYLKQEKQKYSWEKMTETILNLAEKI